MSDRSSPTIRAAKDGPFEVSGLSSIRNANGDEVRCGDSVELCRCGESSDKPFCDYTHVGVGFSSERENPRQLDRERDYVGQQITVHDNRTICCHAEQCVKGLPAVFDGNARPWIMPDAADVPAIIEAINKCPSGALSYSIDGERVVKGDKEAVLTVQNKGAYHIRGAIQLTVEDSDIVPPVKDHYTLCRCGASKNKPFCDGAHHSVGFNDEGVW
jgi:CDGSH-type Zn-finger protein